jgi:hypothetical protein
MNRDQRRRQVFASAAIKLGGDAVMIGREDFRYARRPIGNAQRQIAWDFGMLADGDDGGVHGGIAVAVDHQPGIILQDGEGGEPRGQQARHSRRADIPTDMPPALRLRNAEGSKRARNPMGGVIADDQERRGVGAPDSHEGCWLVGG